MENKREWVDVWENKGYGSSVKQRILEQKCFDAVEMYLYNRGCNLFQLHARRFYEGGF